jgi:hypothetical protein
MEKLARPRILGRHVLDLDDEAAELAFDRDAVLVTLLPRHANSRMRVALGAMPARRSAATTFTLAGEAPSPPRSRGPSKISVFLLDRAEVDVGGPTTVGAPASPAGRLSRLHGHGVDYGLLARP